MRNRSEPRPRLLSPPSSCPILLHPHLALSTNCFLGKTVDGYGLGKTVDGLDCNKFLCDAQVCGATAMSAAPGNPRVWVSDDADRQIWAMRGRTRLWQVWSAPAPSAWSFSKASALPSSNAGGKARPDGRGDPGDTVHCIEIANHRAPRTHAFIRTYAR